MATSQGEFAGWLIGSLRTGLFAVDAEGRVVLVSPEAARTLELREPGRLLGEPAAEVLAKHPALRALLAEGQRGHELPSRAELELTFPDGRESRPIGFTLVSVRDAAGKPCGAALLFRDLTPFERMDEQERLRDRLAALGQMAAGLAHEIRNPLASIQVLVDLLKRGLGDRPDELELVEEVLGEIEGLTRIVNGSLAFVRPHAATRAPVQLSELVDEALRHARARVPFTGKVEVHVPIGLRPSLDALQLERTLVNLIVNAFESMRDAPSREPALRIEAALQERRAPPLRGRHGSRRPGREPRAHLLSVLHHARAGHRRRPRRGAQDGREPRRLGRGARAPRRRCRLPRASAARGTRMRSVPGPETRLLVVEDNRALRVGMARALAERFDVVDVEDRGDAALARLRDTGVEPYDVIVTDLRMPGADGQAVLRAAQERSSRTAVILVTAFASIDAAVAAMKHGAFDFVEKPFPLDELDARVVKALGHARLVGEVTTLRASLSAGRSADQIVGRSAALAVAVELAQRVAPMRSTVLLTGETGTGKELVAGLIHQSSTRAAGPFVKVNCAALPETLLESELFGHEKGAFTSADRVRIGRFEQANGGTLFLDEVGDLSLATQAKLLRALQDQEFQRLGGTRALRTDARIVAATNRDLERAIAQRRLPRGSLLPAQRHHHPAAAAARAPRRHRVAGAALSRAVRPRARPPAQRLLAGRARRVCSRTLGPGNVRELRNAIERAVLLSEGVRVEATDLRFGSASNSLAGDWRPSLPAAGVSMDEIERAVVIEALERHAFVQKEAAAWLGISRRKLNYMIQKMRLTHPSWRRNRDDTSDVS